MATITTRKKEFTLVEAGISAAQAKKLVADGTLVIVGTLQTGRRGRPATLYARA